MTSRRELLKALASLGGVALLAGPGAGRWHSGEAATPPRVNIYRWRDPAAPGALALQAQLGERTYTSAVYRAPGPFNAVGSRWTGTLDRLELRGSADGADWSPWFVVTTHERESAGPAPDGVTRGDLVAGEGWRFIQYRVTVPAGTPLPDVELVLIDASDGPRVAGPLAPEGSAGTLDVARPAIISRAGWGCDESWRFDSSGAEIWPREYRVVQKGIVHHTATSNDYTDGAAWVRSIYAWHALPSGQGWGDIGYNYLVDKWGNIYEGRAGGENVVGGHALQYNYGSTGIACIGDFRYAYPSAQMQAGLARITAWTCRNLDPHGQSYFIDGIYPNICGHRDVMSTECPGANLYSYLLALRDAVQAAITAATPRPIAQVSGVAFSPATMAPGGILRVAVTVANVGNAPMPTQGPAPGFQYQEGQDFRSVGYPEVQGAFRVAVDFEGRSGPVDHPYRWGLPGPLDPGKSVTIEGYVRLSSLQKRDYWAGVVQEGVSWIVSQTGTTYIRVLPSFCFPATSQVAAEPAPSAAEPAAVASLPQRIYMPVVSVIPPGTCD